MKRHKHLRELCGEVRNAFVSLKSTYVPQDAPPEQTNKLPADVRRVVDTCDDAVCRLDEVLALRHADGFDALINDALRGCTDAFRAIEGSAVTKSKGTSRAEWARLRHCIWTMRLATKRSDAAWLPIVMVHRAAGDLMCAYRDLAHELCAAANSAERQPSMAFSETKEPQPSYTRCEGEETAAQEQEAAPAWPHTALVEEGEAREANELGAACRQAEEFLAFGERWCADAQSILTNCYDADVAQQFRRNTCQMLRRFLRCRDRIYCLLDAADCDPCTPSHVCRRVRAKLDAACAAVGPIVRWVRYVSIEDATVCEQLSAAWLALAQSLTQLRDEIAEWSECQLCAAPDACLASVEGLAVIVAKAATTLNESRDARCADVLGTICVFGQEADERLQQVACQVEAAAPLGLATCALVDCQCAVARIRMICECRVPDDCCEDLKEAVLQTVIDLAEARGEQVPTQVFSQIRECMRNTNISHLIQLLGRCYRTAIADSRGNGIAPGAIADGARMRCQAQTVDAAMLLPRMQAANERLRELAESFPGLQYLQQRASAQYAELQQRSPISPLKLRAMEESLRHFQLASDSAAAIAKTKCGCGTR